MSETTPSQQEALSDEHPLFTETRKHFNKTVLTQVAGYLTHKSMLISEVEQCDQKAKKVADDTFKAAFDKTVGCYLTFYQKAKADVKPEIMDIREVSCRLLLLYKQN